MQSNFTYVVSFNSYRTYCSKNYYHYFEFQPRWRYRQICFASSHNPKKDNNQFKNKEQPELTENHLHGSPTTKELKKHSSRLVGGAERGSWGGREGMQQGKVADRVGDPTFVCR